MLGSLNVKGEEVVYVGDNPHVDFYGAKKAGMNTVRLQRGEFRNVTVDKEYEAEYFIELHDEIFRILEALK